jgi:exodeoxyribonuclease VII small subunit
MAERETPRPQPLALEGLLPAAGSADAEGSATPGGGPAEGAPRAADGLPFEQAMAELERIVRELETGELGLDAALALYERGVALVRLCSQQLDAAEARLQVLTVDAAGRPVLRPLEETGS